MRTVEEIKEEIEDVKQNEFLLQMKDYWSLRDHQQYEVFRKQYWELMNELKEATA